MLRRAYKFNEETCNTFTRLSWYITCIIASYVDVVNFTQ